MSNLLNGTTYFFAVTAYDTNGLESDFSTEISYTIPEPPVIPNPAWLTFAADSGEYTAPFAAANGPLAQAVTTSLATSGRAAYT